MAPATGTIWLQPFEKPLSENELAETSQAPELRDNINKWLLFYDAKSEVVCFDTVDNQKIF